MFRNKISETLEAGCLYNGMKSLISDHDYELHLGALRNQAFRNLCRGSDLKGGGRCHFRHAPGRID
jgi:hypothetical protein